MIACDISPVAIIFLSLDFLYILKTKKLADSVFHFVIIGRKVWKSWPKDRQTDKQIKCCSTVTQLQAEQESCESNKAFVRQCQDEERTYSAGPYILKSVKLGWNKWNWHILVLIYHKQCEIMQKIKKKSLNSQLHGVFTLCGGMRPKLSPIYRIKKSEGHSHYWTYFLSNFD